MIENCNLSSPFSFSCIQVPSPSPSSTVNILNAVAVVHSNDVWAVGYSSAYRFGASPLILHYDGTNWVRYPYPTSLAYEVLTGIDFFNSNDIWAVGYDNIDGSYYGVAIHYDGSSWSESIADLRQGPAVNNYSRLYHVFGTPAGDFWAVGSYGYDPNNLHPWVTHWNGRHWASIIVPEIGTNHNLLGVAATLTSTWAVGYYNQQGSNDQLTLVENYAAPTPPAYTTSRYQSQVNLTTHYNQGYCAGARAESGIIVLDYGQPMTITAGPSFGYGAVLFDANQTVASTYAISQAVESFTNGYADAYYHNVGGPPYCLPNVATTNQAITITLGINNADKNGHTAALNAGHATYWANMVRDVKSYVNNRRYTMINDVDAAIDAEPNFEPAPAQGTLTGAETWASAYSNQGVSWFFNFGSTDGYPCIPNPPIPNPANCSRWSPEVNGPERIYTMSWGLSEALPLPEDYFYEWNRHWYLVKRWAKDQHSKDMSFSEATSDCLASPCPPLSGGIIPQPVNPAWQSFWLEINADPFTQTIQNSTYITYTTLP